MWPGFLVPKLSDSLIRQRVKGSDHRPAVLLLALYTLEILKLLFTVLLPCYQRLQITLPCATFVVQFLMLDACTSYDGSN